MVHHFATPAALGLTDSTSNANDGTNSSCTNTNGFQITAGCSASTGAKYTVADAASLEPTELTIGGWFKRAGSSVAYGHMLSKGDGSAAPFGSYKFNFNNTDYSDVWFLVGHTDASYTLLQTGTGIFPDTTWVHWVGTYSTISGVAKLYKNGVLLQTSSAAAVPGILYDTVGYTAFSVNTGNYFNGVEDEIRLYSVVKDVSWILGEYNNQFDPTTFYSISGSPGTPPAAVIPFDPLEGFIRWFHQHMQTTPQHYVSDCRLRQAARELAGTDDSIDHISERNGFPNRNYFTRVFAQKMGLPPGAFRVKSRESSRAQEGLYLPGKRRGH